MAVPVAWTSLNNSQYDKGSIAPWRFTISVSQFSLSLTPYATASVIISLQHETSTKHCPDGSSSRGWRGKGTLHMVGRVPSLRLRLFSGGPHVFDKADCLDPNHS